jgi:cytochrome c oxidase assembly factor CtaG
VDLSNWSLDPSLIYVGAAAALYVLGGLGMRRSKSTPWQEVSFLAGLLTIVLALDSPVDFYSEGLFWVHMGQHILLLTIAPPLILLGRPWPRMWRALPIGTRTTVGRALAGARWTAPIRALARPLPSWLLFNLTIVMWHVPALYDATLSSQAIHNLEHTMFFFAGLLFWAHVIDPSPLRPRLSYPARAAYVVGAMLVGWMLAIALVVIPHPLYAHYADLVTRPGGISALGDQQIAGGMMWVPGSIAYTVAGLFIVWRWLEPQSAPRAPLTT